MGTVHNVVSPNPGHQNEVLGATVLEDRRTALSWSEDGSLRVWDLEAGTEKRALTGHTARVVGATVLEGGRTALSWSADKSLRVWDLDAGTEKRALTGHTARVVGATVLEDGRTALSWSVDKSLRVWDLEAGMACVLMGSGFSLKIQPPRAAADSDRMIGDVIGETSTGGASLSD